MTFQQLRDWHAEQASRLNSPHGALHHKAVELLNSLVEEKGDTVIDTTPFVAQLRDLMGE